MTGGGQREPLVEHRLRQALEARAESVTVRDLRPAAPPRTARRRPWWRRDPAPRFRRVGLAGLVAAALACVAYLTLAPDPVDSRPAPPAVPPRTTSPVPVPSTTPTVTPSAIPNPQPSISLPANHSGAPSTAPTPGAT